MEAHRRIRRAHTRGIWRYHKKRANEMMAMGHMAKDIVEKAPTVVEGFQRLVKRVDRLAEEVGLLGKIIIHIVKHEKRITEQKLDFLDEMQIVPREEEE